MLQETSIRAVHFPSSATTFGMGIVYNFMHTEITRRMSPKYSSTCVWIYRLIISMMGLLSFGLCEYRLYESEGTILQMVQT